MLTALFDQYKIKHAIFFVDTTYLDRLKSEASPACKNDFERIAEQLKNLVRKGHYIFPHIHPHWLDAEYNAADNQWSLKNYSRYRFHKTAVADREKLFDRSIALLKEITDDASSAYELNAYRAGGWSIQPFEDFSPWFDKHGIKHEFSVVPGFRNLAEAQYFDFSNAPVKPVYHFETDPAIEQENGKYTEYTISTLPVTTGMYWMGKLWGKYLWKTGQRSIGDGSGLVIKDETVTGSRKEMLGSKNREMISAELLTTVKLPYYKKFLEKNSYMHFISHPKMLSQHNIKMFGKFLDFAAKKYELKTDFSAMS